MGGRNPLSGGARFRISHGDNPDPSLVIVPGLVPLVDKQTGTIECVVPHLPEVVARLDATLPVSG